ncbi:unnamed protein product [Zymoseptoria tritici ST99CH_1A5]|uniref:USP domain-containing protein n=1 Tax=Zymoseptoria tritici ST99CH_1A5 TaxID=1276529 RepID=A0A1Y6L8G1_ZYMTR|nr:unnamed protein product [Zymoseptoria tritici ST99CH_1A5]
MAEPPLAPQLDHIDPDQHCAVGLVRTVDQTVFGRCQCRLSCKRHSEAQKAAVPDRSRPYHELLARQPMSLGHSQDQSAPRPAPGLPAPGSSTSPAQPQSAMTLKKVIVIDPDVHCAVSFDDGTQCNRPFSCDVHEDREREIVPGRTADLSILRRLWALNSSRLPQTAVNPDTNCAVRLELTTLCAQNLNCSLHSPAQKIEVEGRSLPFGQLLQIQQSQLARRIAAARGYGLAMAGIQTGAPETTRLRRRYRRDGMQNADFDPGAYGDAPNPEEPSLQHSGRNMTRLRQIMYGTNPNDPDQDILSILPAESVRTISETNSSVFRDGSDFHFAFSKRKIVSTLPRFRNHLASAIAKDACLISAMGTDFALDEIMANAVMASLRRILPRVAVDLLNLNVALKSVLLHHALRLTQHAGSAKPKVKFTLKTAVIDNKPSITFELRHFEPALWNTDTIRVALPITSEPNESSVPQPEEFYDFGEVYSGDSWLGLDIPKARARKLTEIASYVVSRLHNCMAKRTDVCRCLAMLSQSFGVPLLVGPETLEQVDAAMTADLAVYDSQRGVIVASNEARRSAPWLPDISDIPSDRVARSVVECINARYLFTRDVWLAWADGSNVADMHCQYGDELFMQDCMCSSVGAQQELHRCLCGKMTLCKDLEAVPDVSSNTFTRLCPNCRGSRSLPDFEFGQVLQPVYGMQSQSNRIQQSKRHSQAKQPSQSKPNDGQIKPKAVRIQDLQAQIKLLQAALNEKQDSSSDEHKRVRGCINTLINQEHALVFPRKSQPDKRAEELQSAYDALLPAYIPGDQTSEGGWTDAYFKTPIASTNSRLMCSIDTDHPIVGHEDRCREHVYWNMFLTRYYANLLAASNPSISLKILHDLDAATTSADVDTLVERLDHLYLIRLQLPWSGTKRLEEAFDSDFLEDFAEQCRTGVPLLSACQNITRQDTINSVSLWRMSGRKTTLNDDQLKDIDDVRKFFRDAERQSGRQFPRINNVPYFFKGGPVPNDWSFSRIYSIFRGRLDVIERSCGRRHQVTFTVPKLACAVFILICYGVEARPNMLLDVPVSIYTRHLLLMSIGKNDHSKAMTCGFHPGAAIAIENFSFAECNLLVEPWSCNSAKGNRDDEVASVQADFRENLKNENLPHWPAELRPLDTEVTRIYITNAVPSDEDSAPGFEIGGRGDRRDSESVHGVVARRNMKNLGQTCYMSVVLQTCHDNAHLRVSIEDDANMIFKEHTGMDDSQFLPRGEFVANLSPAEIQQFRRSTLAKQKLLLYSLRNLFAELDNGGSQLPAHSTDRILNRIAELDNKWQNDANESAELLHMLVTTMVSASDRSEPTGRGALARLGNQQASDNKAGTLLPDIKVDAQRHMAAFRNEGHDSPLTSMLYSQLVSEVPCPDCACVSRGFEHPNVFYLDFPSGDHEGQVFDLAGLLAEWQHDVLDADSGHTCEFNSQHTRSFDKHRCVTYAADYLCLAFRRGVSGSMNIFNQVDCPDLLNISDLKQQQKLPSSVFARGMPGVEPIELPDASNIDIADDYELVGVNNWVGGHYIYYVRDKGPNGGWIMFNDIHDTPTKKAPQEAWAQGELVHYVIYRRVLQQDAEPIDVSTRRPHQESQVERTGTERQTSRTHARGPSTDMQAGRNVVGRTGANEDVSTANSVRLREVEVQSLEISLAEKIKAVEVRERDASRLRDQLIAIRGLRDDYRAAIGRIEDRVGRDEEFANELIHNLRQSQQQLQRQIEPLQAEHQNLEEQCVRAANNLAVQKEGAEQEISELKDKLLALLN